MTDRLRETDALPFSEPELKGWQMGADSGATATNHNVRRFLATIERQGEALRAVEAVLERRRCSYHGSGNSPCLKDCAANAVRAALAQTEPQI